MKISNHIFKNTSKLISIICIVFILILSGCSGHRRSSRRNINVRRPPSGDVSDILKPRSISVLVTSSLEVVDGSVYTDGSTIHCTIHNPWDTVTAIEPKSVYLGRYESYAYLDESKKSEKIKDFIDDYGGRNEEIAFYLNGEETYNSIYCHPNEYYDISFSVAGMTEQEFIDNGVMLLVYEDHPEGSSSSRLVTAIGVY